MSADWVLVTYAVVGLAGVLMLLIARHRDTTRERELGVLPAPTEA